MGKHAFLGKATTEHSKIRENTVPINEMEQVTLAVSAPMQPDDATVDAQTTEGHQVHMEMATRFLNAAEGSEEKAIARVELAIALASEQGVPLQERGGDALAILARRRRQQRQTLNWRSC